MHGELIQVIHWFRDSLNCLRAGASNLNSPTPTDSHSISPRPLFGQPESGKKESYKTNKEESRSLLTGNKTSRVEKTQPIKSEKIYGRNSKVSVKYSDGAVKKDIKYKKVENDIKSEKCVILED